MVSKKRKALFLSHNSNADHTNVGTSHSHSLSLSTLCRLTLFLWECGLQLHQKPKTHLHSNKCFISSSKLTGCLDWRVKSAGCTFASGTYCAVCMALSKQSQCSAPTETVCVCVCLCVEDTGPPALVKENSHMYKDRNSDTHTQRYGKGIYIHECILYIYSHSYRDVYNVEVWICVIIWSHESVLHGFMLCSWP